MKSFKIAILIFILLVIGQGIGFCELVDETGAGEATASNDIPDRPMRDDANLKAIQVAFDNSDSRANVKRFAYDANITYKIRLREFMGSTVVLPTGEKIAAFELFDNQNFSFTPLSDKNPVLTNIFSVHAKFHGADTNLLVHGESGNLYSFYLRNDSVASPFMPSLVTYIEDEETTKRIKDKQQALRISQAATLAVEQAKNEKKEKSSSDYLKEIPTKIDGNNLNFDYIFKGGNEKIKPIRVFDDGYFTWFQFGEKNLNKVQNLPTIYRVIEGYDTPVNSRVIGGSIIAETISDKWTIRSGETHYCIWQDK